MASAGLEACTAKDPTRLGTVEEVDVATVPFVSAGLTSAHHNHDVAHESRGMTRVRRRPNGIAVVDSRIGVLDLLPVWIVLRVVADQTRVIKPQVIAAPRAVPAGEEHQHSVPSNERMLAARSRNKCLICVVAGQQAPLERDEVQTPEICKRSDPEFRA
jgi:hypothetical protein